MTKKEMLLNEYGQLTVAIDALVKKRDMVKQKLLGKETEYVSPGVSTNGNGNGKKLGRPPSPKQDQLLKIMEKHGKPMTVEELMKAMGYSSKQAVYQIVHELKVKKKVQGGGGVYELRP
jgi:hypothetical protein